MFHCAPALFNFRAVQTNIPEYLVSTAKIRSLIEGPTSLCCLFDHMNCGSTHSFYFLVLDLGMIFFCLHN